MQIVVLSGKGGTGKTTVVSSLAYLMDVDVVKIDADVDASNLHLMFQTDTMDTASFTGGQLARISDANCIACGQCFDTCRFDAISTDGVFYKVDPLRCEGCGACSITCPVQAITLEADYSAKTLKDKSNWGLMGRAKMVPGSDGSGKLVTAVRGFNMDKTKPKTTYLIDGSPGIGCSVMASITGCDYGIIVTEPSQSGFEDFKRLYELMTHFSIKPMVIINKSDMNEAGSKEIEAFCDIEGIQLLGKIPYDSTVSQGINKGRPVIFYKASQAGSAMRHIYNQMKTIIGG